MVPLPDTIVYEYNFHNAAKIAEQYFDAKQISKEEGSGYAVYKRWEHYWQDKINEDGTMPTFEQLTKFDGNSNLVRRKTRGGASNWTCIGPSIIDSQKDLHNGYGRVNYIAIDPNNAARIFIGTPAGGLWRTIDTGNTWQALTGTFPFYGISGIAIDKNNSNIIYISTGDRDGGNSISHGIYKSIDGGNTWIHLSNSYVPGIYTRYVEIDPNDSKKIFFGSNLGLFKSVDSGITWTLVLPGNISDFKFMPGNSNIIYTVNNTGPKVISKSIDNGNTFTDLTIPNDIASAFQVLLGTTAANPNVLYLYSSNGTYNSRIYKSTDAGSSFTLKNSTEQMGCPQCNYDMAFAVSNQNENLLYTGCLGTFRSVDGGSNWTLVNWYHYDIHHLLLDDQNVLFSADDGGFAFSLDSGMTYINKSKGLHIEQIYHTDLHASSSNIVNNGLQDNGAVLLSNNQWRAYRGGDVVDVCIDPTNASSFYAMGNGGGIFGKYDYATDSFLNILPPVGGYINAWIIPIEITTDGTLYAGFKYVYRLDASNTWQQVSTTAARTTAMEADPHNPNRLLFATSSPQGFYEVIKTGSTDIVNSLFYPPSTFSIISISIDEDEPKNIYALSSSNIYVSKDSGLTWQDITGNLQGATITSIAHEKNSLHNNVYVTTYSTILFKNDTMQNWEPYNNGLPTSSYTDLEINTLEGNIVASSYGRSIWRSPLPNSSLAVIDRTRTDALLYPNPAFDYFRLNTTIQEPSSYKVFDVKGRQMMHQTLPSIQVDTKFSLQGLNRGVYIIEISSRSHLIRKKIILE